MSIPDDLYWFGNTGRSGVRVATGFAGAGGGDARKTPFTAVNYPNVYDPSQLAAAFRLLPRIVQLQPFVAINDAMDTMDDLYNNATSEFRNNAAERFTLNLDYGATTVHERYALEKADYINGDANKRRWKMLNVVISEEARLWGVDRTILASVVAGELIRLNSPMNPLLENYIVAQLKAKKARILRPRPKIYGSAKKTRNTRRMSKKRRSRK